MSKKLHFKSWLLMLCMLLGVGNVWAQSSTSTLDFAAKCNGSGTADDGAVWTVTSDGTESQFDNAKGIHYGTNKQAVQYIQLSTSDISGTITSVVVNASGASGVAATLSVTVGGNAFGTAQSISTSATNYTFTGSASGEIVVLLDKGSSLPKAIYVKSVVVTYSASNPGDTRTATTVTIDDSGITNTNVFEGTAAGSFSATVMAGESAVSGASVTWESETPSVATIDAASGVVTLVAAGSTKITATYAGDTSYKNSSATYTLTVTNDDPNGPGTENNPYTVAQARAAIDAGTGVTGVYATGIVSEIVTPFDSGYGNITYNISADGSTTADQLQAYRGKSYNGDWFTSADDIQVGDEVVIYGNLTLYKGTYEFAQNNQLVSLQRTELLDNVITVTGGTEYSMDPDNNNELTLEATATSGGVVTFTLDTENTTLTVDDDFFFDADNGYLCVYNTYAGTIVIKANSAATETYKAAPEVTITINVSGQKITPTIVVADANVPYGSTFTVDDSVIEGGDITVTSSNTNVATVSDLVITPIAVGTTTITVRTAENTLYNAGEETFTLTVTGPAGKTEAPSAASEATFDFSGNAWSLPTDKTSTAGDYTDGTYTISLANGSYYYYSTYEALLMGKTNTTLTFPAFDKAVTQIDVVGTSGASTSVKQNIYVGDVAVSTETTGAKDVTNEYVIDESYQAAGNIYVLKVTSNHNTQISSIVVHFAAGGGSATESVTLNAYGYKTFASEYPLDFSGDNDFTAWELTNIDSEGNITFNEIKDVIKGGQGVLLKGEAGSEISISMADGDVELTDNLFEATLAPTYVADKEYWGLSGNSMMKINEGIVPVGKAILNDSWVNISSSVKTFTFVFNSTDGIQTIEKVSAEEAAKIFDLSGRRLTEMRRGVNIVNGKKIMVK